MHDVGCRLVFDVIDPSAVAVQLAPAGTAGLIETERLDVVGADDRPPPTVVEVGVAHAGRIHVVTAAPGRLSIEYTATFRAAVPGALRRGRGLGVRGRGDRGLAPEPVLPVGRARGVRARGVRPARRRRVLRAGVADRVVGVRAHQLRVRNERRVRHGDRHPDAELGRVPRLRAPHDRAVPRLGDPGPAGRGVRPGPRPDGLPRGHRGAHAGRLVRPRRHPTRPAADAGPDRHGSRRGRHGVGHDAARRRRAARGRDPRVERRRAAGRRPRPRRARSPDVRPPCPAAVRRGRPPGRRVQRALAHVLRRGVHPVLRAPRLRRREGLLRDLRRDAGEGGARMAGPGRVRRAGRHRGRRVAHRHEVVRRALLGCGRRPARVCRRDHLRVRRPRQSRLDADSRSVARPARDGARSRPPEYARPLAGPVCRARPWTTITEGAAWTDVRTSC